MSRYIAGVVTGIIIGTAAGAFAATVAGDGYLMGWSVMKDGEEICSDPFVWRRLKEVECD